MKVSGGATWVWWCIMMMMMGVKSSLAMEEVESQMELQNFETVIYDLSTGSNAQGYKDFLKRFRDAVKAKDNVCDILATSSTTNYIYVQLKLNKDEWVTVGLATTDLYVWGWQDNKLYNKKLRARFFKEVIADAFKQLFGVEGKDITKTKTATSVNYDSMEKPSRFKRSALELKVNTLQEVTRDVYGKTEKELTAWDKKNPNQPEANFFFVVCQMIAEATRFQSMEKAILDFQTKTKSAELTDFQNNWGKISTSIHGSAAAAANDKCKTLKPALKLDKKDYKTVADIKDKMGIIKFKSNKFNSLEFKDFLLADDAAFLESALM